MTSLPADSTGEDEDRKRTLLESLYRDYGQTLRTFLARRRVSREQAADIVQETYCRVQQADSVESIRQPKAFLIRVASNVLLNSRRHHRHALEESAPDFEGLEVANEDPSAYRQMSAEQELAIVRAALMELPPKCRQAFVMNRLDNLSYPQVAREMGLSVSMIEKYISQALAHMRGRLSAADRPTTRPTRVSK